jgi:hypothetical protein
MSSNSRLFTLKNTSAIRLFFTITFFLASLIEIYAEYIKDISLQWFVKPLLLPILIILYLFTSKKVSSLYLVALFFNWLANLLFISSEMNVALIASVSFLMYRVFIILKIFKDDKTLGIIPIVLGSIPFMFLFLSLINIVYENINIGQFLLMLFQAMLMTLVGGFSLAKFIIKNDLSSKMLLISSLFFGINLFILGVKFYFFDFVFLKPISMVFFVLGHFIFYQYIVLNEKNSHFSD